MLRLRSGNAGLRLPSLDLLSGGSRRDAQGRGRILGVGSFRDLCAYDLGWRDTPINGAAIGRGPVEAGEADAGLAEVRLEEVYYYRVHPASGFAVQVRYDTDTGQEDLRMVRDGDAAAITSGFHPLVAAPGHGLYYLWVLAGEQRAMRVYVDPRYRWVTTAG